MVTADQLAVAPQEVSSEERQAKSKLAEIIRFTLDEAKAEEIVVIDLEGKSSVTDLLVIASGHSDRQVLALADRVAEAVKKTGLSILGIEGKPQGDWVLIDAGDAIIHIFRPEVRTYYNLEKMWGGPIQLPVPASSP